jgi:ribosome recycling factor
MLEAILKDATEKMHKAVEVFKHEQDTLRTGRASVHLLDGVRVSMYGNESPVNQVATVSTPDAHTVVIQPWDKGALGAIEKAILAANIGLTPTNDGAVVRLNIPPMTEQSRKEMVKRLGHLAEESRVAIRNVRRHANDEIKKAEKKSGLSEDEIKRITDKVQKLTDENIKQVDAVASAKEKEILKV